MNITAISRGVAQPGSAPGLGPGGRRFESFLPDHIFNLFYIPLIKLCDILKQIRNFMDFCHFLTSYMPDPNIGSEKHFQNMIDQSILAEKLGYKTVSIPEHHLINILMMPSPLQMAVKIATLTKKINITTGISVLPLHDMRTYAGDVATADILTNGRLILGVGRGAFAWEMERLGSPINDSKEKFIESLKVLQLLLSEKKYLIKVNIIISILSL